MSTNQLVRLQNKNLRRVQNEYPPCVDEDKTGSPYPLSYSEPPVTCLADRVHVSLTNLEDDVESGVDAAAEASEPPCQADSWDTPSLWNNAQTPST